MRTVFKYLTDVRLWYALAGILISIAAHEAFHLAAHMGDIEKITVFPNALTIMEVTLISPGILPHDTEEAIAYSITVLILFLTIIDVFAISDSRDRRTVDQILTLGNQTKYLQSSKRKPTAK